MSSPNSLISIATFSGSSTFATSFQQVLTRAVQLASLPGELVQASINNLSSQQQAMASLLSTFASLQGAVQGVASAVQGSISASVSNSAVLSATAATTASPGTYTVTVDNIGAATTAISGAGSPPVTDPTTGNISGSPTYTLKIGGVAQPTITPTGTSLQDLANAINNSGDGVQATIVNLGGSSGADYRLALTSNKMGSDALELDDNSSADLMTQMTPGTDVLYKVNGGSDIHSNTRQVTLSPGLTLNLLSQSPSSPVTVTVSNNQGGLQSALSSLASAYNSAVNALAAQRGQNPGSLAGQSTILDLQSMLSNLSHFNGSGNIANPNALGLEVDQNGQMSLNTTTFNKLDPNDIEQFLGGTTTGGFLQAANDAMNSVTDTTTGSLEVGLNVLQDRILADQKQLADDTTRVTDLQNTLMAQLSAADAAIAGLESQKNYFIQLFQATYGTNAVSK